MTKKQSPEHSSVESHKKQYATSSKKPISQSRKEKVKQKHYVRNGIIVVAVLLFLVIGYHVFKFVQFYNKIQIQADTNANQDEQELKKVYNFLLMGYGGEGHSGEYLTDTLMIAHVNIEKKKVKLISIPRDVWVKVPTVDEEKGFYSKINSIYQMSLNKEKYPDIATDSFDERGAAGFLKIIVKRISGLEIDYFVAIDFQGFVKAIDTLGGIEVDVERAFDDYLYPVTGKEADMCGRVPKPTMTDDQMRQWLEDYKNKSPEEQEAFDNRPLAERTEEEFQKVATESPHLAYPCRYEHIHYDAGLQEMDGENALKFARSRQALQDGGDFNRAARQQRVIQAVRDKVLSVGFLPKIVPLLEELDDHVRMDVPFETIQRFMAEAQNADEYEIESNVLSNTLYLQDSTSADGQAILVPQAGIGDWDAIKNYVSDYVNDVTPTPTPDPAIEATKEAALDN